MEPNSPRMEAFVVDLTRHQRRLHGFVRCLLFDPKDVADVVQEINLTLLRKCDDFQAGSDFWSWASQVARYQVLTYSKRLGRDRLVFDEELLATIADELSTALDSLDAKREALSVCLQGLPAPQRQMLEMKYTLDHSIEQISSALQRPEASIRQTLYRIRQALLNCMERRLASEGSQ